LLEKLVGQIVLIQRWLVLSLLACSPAHAIEIACGGYSPALNDHVEWSIKVAGANADFDGQHFKVSESKKLLILAGPRFANPHRQGHKKLRPPWPEREGC